MSTSQLENVYLPWLSDANTAIWRCPFDPVKFKYCIDVWLVYAPWMHPMWSYHWCYLVNLFEHEKDSRVSFQFPGATHEFGVFALNPEYEPTTLEPRDFHPLEPISIAQQFRCDSDPLAKIQINDNLRLVLQHRLSLDSDFRSTWRRILRPLHTNGENNDVNS